MDAWIAHLHIRIATVYGTWVIPAIPYWRDESTRCALGAFIRALGHRYIRALTHEERGYPIYGGSPSGCHSSCYALFLLLPVHTRRRISLMVCPYTGIYIHIVPTRGVIYTCRGGEHRR